MNARQLSLEGKVIAFFHQSSDLYGSDRILLALVEAVRMQGGHPVVVLPDTGPLTEEFLLRDVEFYTMPVIKLSRTRMSFRGLRDLISEFLGMPKVYDHMLLQHRVDLVHSNTLAVLGGALWARRRHIPHLWHVHEIVERPQLLARLFPLLVDVLADSVVCNSGATCQWLLDSQPRLIKKTHVVWNGISAPSSIDEDAIYRLRREFCQGGVRLAVGLVGRINRGKGQELLLKAAELLYRKGVKDFSVVFMGSAPAGHEYWEVELRQLIALSPLREQLFFRGFDKNVWPMFAALDIVCVPSTEAEAFGLVALEAMAMAKPVVASRIGGLPEVVIDGVTGLTVSPGSATDLAAALEKLFCDDELRGRMGRAGKERFDAEFCTHTMTERFYKTYAETIEQK